MGVETHNNYIGGRWVPSAGGATYTITNPASKSQALGEFQSSTEGDARDAVAAASAALGGWADTPAPSRAAVLFKALDLLERRSRRDSPHDHPGGGQADRRRHGRGQARDEHHRVRGRRGPPHVRIHHTVRAARHHRLHGEEARRRRGDHHAVELPARHSRLEDRPRAHMRQRAGVQARLLDAHHRRQARPDLRGGRTSARRPEPRHRPRLLRRPRIRGEPGRQGHLLHGLHRDRDRHLRRRGSKSQEGAVRDGGQERRDPPLRRRSRQGTGRHRPGRVRLDRPAVHPRPAG